MRRTARVDPHGPFESGVDYVFPTCHRPANSDKATVVISPDGGQLACICFRGFGNGPNAGKEIQGELATWEAAIGGDYLAGGLSAVDFTLYPEVTLALRIAKRKPDLATAKFLGPKMTAWMQRMEALPGTEKTWPPHWK